MNFYPTITMIIIFCVTTTRSTSKYGGVSWNEKKNLWQAEFYNDGKKQKSYFDNEVDAAKKLNMVHDKKTEILPQDTTISEILNQQKKGKNKSQFIGVTWEKHRKTWRVQLSLAQGKRKSGGYFYDELDAAKKVNQLCEELGIPHKNLINSAMTNQGKEKKSQFNGVCWSKQRGKWRAQLYSKDGSKKYGGYFSDEYDAAKRINQLCEEFGIPITNPEINGTPNEQKKEKTSQFNGVHWCKQRDKWFAQLYLKDGSKTYGGCFSDEYDAAKKVNQLCEEFGISATNPGINGLPNEQKKEKLSQFKGVYWNKKNKIWYALIQLKGGKQKNGGSFSNELEAANKVNQLYQEFGICIQNHKNDKNLAKEKSSQYKGVYWNKDKRKWYVLISLKGAKQKYGGMFEDELDAAKRVNQLCEKFKIPSKNLEIIDNTISNQQYQKTLIYSDTIQAEIESLIQILDENKEDLTAATMMKENLIEAIKHKAQQTKMKIKINLRTKNGESALSIAAKHGLSNAVKFLISKGAEKQHFTHNHETPLSLAVSHNHLKVVQVLFETWISPNVHEKPYLHSSPIFNVKSKEIAQLLIDNDAVTHDIYNGKYQSPLTVACQNGYLTVVEFFLDDGLDINHLDNVNKTPLFYALENKHHDITHLLISKGGLIQ